MDRFWNKVDQSGGPDACWLWMAGKSQGYGVFRIDGRSPHAHRVAYALLVGDPPDGHDLHHTCANRACVNPAHLEVLTHSAHGRLKNVDQTHCRHGHPLAGTNLYVYPNGRRSCRECSARANREYRRRKVR